MVIINQYLLLPPLCIQWAKTFNKLFTYFLVLFWAPQVALGVKNLPANAGDARDMGSIPGWGRSLGVGNGNPLQYSFLESHGQRSLVGYSPKGRKESDTTEHTHPALFKTKKVRQDYF